jgi:hypothetical protein
MVRTILRNGSGDLVTLLQLADRTGIVAASAPPAAPDPGTLDPGGLPRPAGSRRVRRQALVVCAALALVTLGWIGGETFAHSALGQTPPVAVGTTGILENDDQADVPAPPAPQVVPVAPATTKASSPTPAAKRAVSGQTAAPKTSSKSTTADTPAPARSSAPSPSVNVVERATSMMNALAGGFGGFRWPADYWKQFGNGAQGYYWYLSAER